MEMLFILTTIFVLMGIIVSFIPKSKPKEENVSSGMTRKQLLENLKWMHSKGIITHQEYNHLLTKALPFTKG